jgi:hypothetical protein
MQPNQLRDFIPQVTRSTSLTASFFLLIFVFSSCAGTYHNINPKGLTYGFASEVKGISYSYRHNVLSETGNKKYAKKEAKKPVKLIALEITNTTDRTINVGREVKIYMGDRQVLPVASSVMYDQLRQPAGLFMLWGLLWVIYSQCDSNGDCSSTPIPVGLLIGIGNTATASSANKKFKLELTEADLLTKSIAPGETVQGLIGISSESSGPISLRID